MKDWKIVEHEGGKNIQCDCGAVGDWEISASKQPDGTVALAYYGVCPNCKTFHVATDKAQYPFGKKELKLTPIEKPIFKRVRPYDSIDLLDEAK